MGDAVNTQPKCFYFGCWNSPGHYMFGANGRSPSREFDRLDYYGDDVHLDGTLAPRTYKRTGLIVWQGQAKTKEARNRIEYDAEECPQGQFLLHVLDSGYTAIQWWDRTQGDTRGACNSTILLEGTHTVEEMIAALHEHFPHVAANLAKAGIALVEVK